MNLTEEELRVLACLVEKSYTTPDQYPMSSNALTAACNQKTSRDPIVDYPLRLVDETLQLLRDAGWVRSSRGAGSRVFKHRQLMAEVLGLSAEEESLLAVLALRGPQSAGELRTRTERYVDLPGTDEVEAVLAELARRTTPLVRNVGRASGQSQDRWIQILGPTATEPGFPVGRPPVPADQPPLDPSTVDRSDEHAVIGSADRPAAPSPDPSGLEARVTELERRLARLEAALGVED